MKTVQKKDGFTLVEVLLASMIAAFVAVVAVGTLRAVSTAAEMVESNACAAAEMRFASDMVATDLINIYRDPDMKKMRLVAGLDSSGDRLCSWLVLYTVGRVKARIDQPEGEVYEVEYFLRADDEESVLCRRLWPNPDRETEPGGVVTVIAEDIELFGLRFFDGQEWQLEWPEEMESIPQLVEVTIAAKRLGRGETPMETFVVNFARPFWGEADEDEESSESEEKEDEDKDNEEKDGENEENDEGRD
ncbi:MAG: type II secretion system protein GspJ [Planctomycetota bacterium]|jgi:general secretion pathway protein J